MSTAKILDGDQLMAMIVTSWQESGRLTSGALVATVMSNMGLEKYIESLGLGFKRTKVGDRYVIEEMRKGGFNIGGEQSGHIIMGDYGTTGDGLIAALQILALRVEQERPISEYGHVFEPYPQILKNVRYEPGSQPFERDEVKKAIKRAEKELGDQGRILVRASGTEPLIRVMVEGKDQQAIEKLAEDIADLI